MPDTIRVSTRGRVTIPKSLRERLGWKPGAVIELTLHPKGVELQLASSAPDGS